MIKLEITGTLRSYSDVKTSKRDTSYRLISMCDGVGEEQSADVFEIILFGNLAEHFTPREKNCPLNVNATLKSRDYVDKNGTTRRSLSLLGNFVSFPTPNEPQIKPSQPPPYNDEDIPF